MDDHNIHRHFDCLNERPVSWRPPLTHERIRAGAHQLAASISAGEFDALSAEQRCDLRALTLEMLAWADEVYSMEVPTGRIVNLRPRLTALEGGRP